MCCKLNFRVINFRRRIFFAFSACFSLTHTPAPRRIHFFCKEIGMSFRPIQNCRRFHRTRMARGNMKRNKSVERQKVVHTFLWLSFFPSIFTISFLRCCRCHLWCGSQSEDISRTPCNGSLSMRTAELSKKGKKIYLSETFLLSIRNSNIQSFVLSIRMRLAFASHRTRKTFRIRYRRNTSRMWTKANFNRRQWTCNGRAVNWHHSKFEMWRKSENVAAYSFGRRRYERISILFSVDDNAFHFNLLLVSSQMIKWHTITIIENKFLFFVWHSLCSHFLSFHISFEKLKAFDWTSNINRDAIINLFSRRKNEEAK